MPGLTRQTAWPFARRAARAVLLAAATVWAIWVVGAQAFLWTPLLRTLLNGQGKILHVEYAGAWSIWPGTIHARNLIITSQDRSVQWRLGLDQTTFSVALGELAGRIFHVEHVRARGVQFALRRRIPGREAFGDRIAGLPVIEGLPRRPAKDEGPDDLLPDARYRLWSVWLEDVRGEGVRQIWIDKFRVEDADVLAGAFYLKPLRELLIAPGELRLSRATLHRDRDALADGIAGTLRIKLGRVNPKGATPERLFPTVDAQVDLRAHATPLPLLGGHGGAGEARVTLTLEEGKVQPGASISLDLAQGALRGVHAAGARLELDVAKSARATLTLHSARFARAGLRAESVKAVATGPAPDLAALRPPSFAAIDLRGGSVDDVRTLGAWLLGDDRVEAGEGAFSVHLQGPPRRLDGWVHGSLSGLQVAARGVRARGDVRVEAKIAALDPGRGADLSGTRVSVAQARLVPDLEISPGWWGDFVLSRALVALPARRLTAQLDARCRDARPIVGLYAHLKDLPGFLNSLFGMDGLTLHGNVEAGPGWFVLPEVSASGDGASVRATLRQDREGQRGAALLSAHGISVALDLDGGHSGLHLFGPGDFFEERKAQVRAGPPPRAEARRAPRRPR